MRKNFCADSVAIVAGWLNPETETMRVQRRVQRGVVRTEQPGVVAQAGIPALRKS